MKSRNSRRFRTGEAMADFAAGLFKKALLRKTGKFTAALSGGRTPARFFKKLAALDLPWNRVIFFMADERRAPLSSPESNYAAARAQLFSKIKIPRANLRPLKPGCSAAAYSREFLKETGGSGRLDFILLGLGEDGHTASLFPGSRALKTNKNIFCPVLAPDTYTTRRRVTLSLKAINASSNIVLLASGPRKKKIFEKALLRDKNIPAGFIKPRGEIHFLFSGKE